MRRCGCAVAPASHVPRDGTSADEMVRAADMAMYQARRDGKNPLAEYTGAMARLTQSRHRIEIELRRALAQREFVLYYQPRVDMESWHTVGAEALLRWQHPKRGLLAPAEFIDVAEKAACWSRSASW